MSTYLIGDIHGCYREFCDLLNQVKFDPAKDELWLTGDLVARGADSLLVLRKVYELRDSVRLVLGNHDLHLLGVYAGISKKKSKDKLEKLLAANDCDQLLNWLRRQPLLQVDHQKKLVMTHAGITPQWDLATAQHCAWEVNSILSSDCYPLFLNAMYGDQPNSWDNTLMGLTKLRFSSNALTRMRYCLPDGRLDMICKEPPDRATPPLKPWFDLPRRIPEDYSIVFGHWASLSGKGTPKNVIALDTGCCWGGQLTLLRWEDKHYFQQDSRKDKKN